MELQPKDQSFIIYDKPTEVMMFNESNQRLLVNASIVSLTINGSNNKIIIEGTIQYLNIVGSNNEIDATYFKNILSSIFIYGNENIIQMGNGSTYWNETINGDRNQISVAIYPIEDQSYELSEEIIKRKIFLIEEMIEFQTKDLSELVLERESTCPICIRSFEENDTLNLFPCNSHIYHKECLNKWLIKSNLCPLCKYDMLVESTEV